MLQSDFFAAKSSITPPESKIGFFISTSFPCNTETFPLRRSFIFKIFTSGFCSSHLIFSS